ncbi:MAG: LysM peptidoglycan-binding domain-containing protein [Rhodocyclaceae bacterium]|nr:LysM peptidoglycan-binding domain-containing protein [Rhodocyclaceae bacterium]
MTNSLKKTLLAASLAALPLTLNAAGLGRINVFSALGQPLNAEIEVQANADEISSMRARMAPAASFQNANVPFSPVISLIQVAVEPRGDGAVLKLSSDRPINEPFVDMVLEMSWANGKLIREYTFLLDPSVSSPKPVSTVTSQPAPAVAATPAPAPVAAPAPRAAPSRPAALAAAPQAKAEDYRVKRGDTLSRIARAHKSPDVSLEQMLVALQRRNPDAFVGDNMNRLMAGRILSIPSADEAAAITQGEARREVVAQSADFNAYRQRLAETVRQEAPVAEAEGQQQMSGLIKPRIAEAPKPEDAARDQVRVSRTETGAGLSQDAGERLRMLEEDLAARDRALAEANDRLAELERNIGELQKLIELKNEGLAKAQQSAEQAAAAPQAGGFEPPVATPAAEVAAAANAPAAASQAATSPAAASEAAAPTPAVEAAPSVDAAAAAEAAKTAEAAPAGEPAVPVEPPPAAVAEAPKPVVPPPAPTPAPAAAPPPAPPPVAAPGFIDELMANPTLVAAGGGVLALLLALGLMRSRKKRGEAEAQASMNPPSELSMGGSSIFGTSGGQSVDTGSSVIQTDFSQSGMSAIDADEGVDPVAEADVYMAYGRDAQAEEILLDALKVDPSRAAVHLKLLEIYAQRKSTSQFETTASELYSLTGGQGDDWSRAADMGRQIDPDNPLYSEAGGAAAAAAASAVGATAAAAAAASAAAKPAAEPADVESNDVEMSALDFAMPGSKPEIEGASAKLKDTWAMPGELSQFDGSGEAHGDTGGLSKAGDSSLDFNLDLGEAPEEQGAAEAPPTEGGGIERPATDGDMTVKLSAADIADGDDSTVIIKSDDDAPKAEDDLVLADASETTLEFDLDMGDGDVGAPASEPVTETPAEAVPPSQPVDVERAVDEPAVEAVAESDLKLDSDQTASALDFDLDVVSDDGDDSVLGDAGAEEFELPDLDLTADAGDAPAELDAGEEAAEDIDLSATVANPVTEDEEMATDLEQSSFDGTLLDFDFDLDKPADAKPADVEATALDISSIDLDLEAQDAEQTAAEPMAGAEAVSEATPVAADAAVAEQAAPVADDTPGDPEVDTKLELARAYEEMGDKDGAKELLDEVLAEGNNQQQEQARLVMSRL